MVKSIRYTFLISLLLPTAALAQFPLGYFFRVGIDPVYTSSLLIPQPSNLHQRLFEYRNWETNLELVGPFRTSFVAEFGHTDLYYNADEATLLYHSHGNYGRLGCNFDLTEAKLNYELDLGWRIGVSQVNESALVNYPGTYWGADYDFQYSPRQSFIHWAEILMEYKRRIFPKNKHLKNLWCGTSLRLKYLPGNNGTTELYKTYYVPGYGPGWLINTSLNFTLFYSLHFKHQDRHKVHHLHDNLEIIYKKNHATYQRRRYNDVANDLERE